MSVIGYAIEDSDIKRFLSKVDKKSDDECWPWLGGKTGKYGCFWLGQTGTITAHRVAYMIATDDTDIVECHIHHTCFNELCMNPAHLTRETAHSHMLKGNSRPAKQARQTHCKRGHKFTPENTYTYNGMRHCRMCHKLHQRAYLSGRRLP